MSILYLFRSGDQLDAWRKHLNMNKSKNKIAAFGQLTGDRFDKILVMNEPKDWEADFVNETAKCWLTSNGEIINVWDIK